MNSNRRVLLSVAFVFIVFLFGFVGAAFLARQPAPPISLEEVRALYGDGVSYVQVAGVDVAYKDEGHGETILLLHGSFGSLHMFDELAEQLTKRYRVIRYDQPPSGLSGSVPADFSLTAEEFLDRFLTKINAGSVALVGTSSGGIIAYRYAASYPQKTRALVLSNVPPSAPVDNKGARSRLPTYLRYSLTACIKFSGPFSKTCWRDFLVSNYERKERVNTALVERYFDLNRRQGSLVYTSMTAIMREDAKVKHFLSKVSAPTALVWGDVDPVLPKETAELMAERLTHTDAKIYWLDEVSHYPPMEAPFLFAVELEKFLGGLTQMSPSIGRNIEE